MEELQVLKERYLMLRGEEEGIRPQVLDERAYSEDPFCRQVCSPAVANEYELSWALS